jgi:hypothetical protein
MTSFIRTLPVCYVRARGKLNEVMRSGSLWFLSRVYEMALDCDILPPETDARDQTP